MHSFLTMLWSSVALGAWHDVDPSALLVKHDFTIAQRVQCVVATGADIPARMPFRTTLAHKNVASQDRFPTEFLHASALSLGITTVSTGALSLLMSHFSAF